MRRGNENILEMERNHLGNPGIDGRIIFKMDLQVVRCWGMNRIKLAQDRDRWRELVGFIK
jgi:hypothetical protein